MPDGAFGPVHDIEHVASGANGPVFRARQKGSNRFVTIEWFSNGMNADRARRMVSELERLVAAPLDHPAIAKPLAAGTYRSAPYLVQEYEPGESLDALVRADRPLPVADVMRWATQIAGALDFAAVVRVHHGALNLRSVLIARGDARVAGFGVAEALKRAASADAAIDRRSDITGLALLVYQLLCHRAVAGDARDVLTVIGARYGPAVRDIFARPLGDRSRPSYDTALSFIAALMPAVERTRQAQRFDTVDVPLAKPTHPARRESAAVPPLAPARAASARWPMLAVMLMLGVAIGAAGERALVDRSEAARPQTTVAQHQPDQAAADAIGTSGSGSTNNAPRSSVRTTASTARSAEPTGSNRSSMSRPQPDAARTEQAPQNAAISSDAPVSDGTMLYVDSTPRGATLYLDDKFIGTTPLAVAVTDAGDHLLRLERSGSHTWSSPVHVQANRLNRVVVTLDEP